MNAAVCVLVTVPTEQEEEKRQMHATSTAATKHFRDDSQQATKVLQLPGLKEDAAMEQVLRRIAFELQLEHVFWTHDVAGGQLQARFDLWQDERYERLLTALQDWGIGQRPDTHVTAINCLETRPSLTAAAATEDAGLAAGLAAGPAASNRPGWQSFMDSVRCRLNVNQVVRVVRRDATINFDFVVLLMAAALLSCVGLVENSFLFLSSSMLISPLMGPIIAGIFGSVIGDRELRWLGIRNELIGLGISVVTGFIFGLAICLCGLGSFFVLSAGFTEEILSRCDTHSLIIGLCTALASGAAAAIGVLGGNTGSLVGVAISASLLPPAVNAGLLWSIALCSQLFQVDSKLLQNLSKHQDYSQKLHIELFVCGTVSMALTLLNVICVWLMGVVVLRIKEVAPAVQRDQHFWRHDVRLAREVALNDPELHDAIDQLDTNERRHVDLEAPQYQHTWSPGSAPSHLQHVTTNSNNYHTVHGFKDFCNTLHRQKLPRAPDSTLPSFMAVFTPQQNLQQSLPPNVASSKELPSSSNLNNNHRSLPDLRVSSCNMEVESLVSLNSLPQHSRQLLLPLQPLLPDRQLQLLPASCRKVNSEQNENEHEFNV